MKLSTRTRYAVRALVELGYNYDGESISLKNIAENQGISTKYLEHMMAVLKSAGFVRSIRGAGGGYMLAKSPEKIRMSDVFTVLEGSVVTVECVEDNDFCKRAVDCPAKHLWEEVQQAVFNVLRNKSLQDLIDESGEKEKLHYQI